MRKFLRWIIIAGSIFASGAIAQVNLLTGLPEKEIELISLRAKSGLNTTVNLIYKGSGAAVASQTRNDVEPVSWAGFSWVLTFPSIFVDHRGTTDLNDDHWFYKDNAGNVTEILRVPEADASGNLISEAFYLKNNPYWKITAIDNSPGTTKIRKIIGWEIVDREGTKYCFGALNSNVTDANRKIIHWDNMVYKGIPGGTAGTHYDDFYYQWDLKQIRDINNSTITYSYFQPNATVNTYAYTKESYVRKIESDNGDYIEFIRGTKHLNEGRAETFQGDFDFTESMFLDEILLKHKDGIVVENIKFVYSDPNGTLVNKNINWNRKGFSKRLLIRVEPVRSKTINYGFTYNEYGLLNNIYDLKMGENKSYEYIEKPVCTMNETIIPLEKTFSSHFNVTKTTIIGKHIFFEGEIPIPDQPNTGTVLASRIEVVTKVNGKWVKNDIPGITGQNFFGGEILPGDNRLIIIKGHDFWDWSSHDVLIYEYVNSKWDKVFETTLPIKKPDFPRSNHKLLLQQGLGYFTVFESYRGVIYVFSKINGTWVSTFNAPSKPDGCVSPTKCGISTGFNMVFGNDNSNGDGTGNGWRWPDEPLNNHIHTKEVIHGQNVHFLYKRNIPRTDLENAIVNNFWWDVINNKWVQRSYGLQDSYAEFNNYVYRKDAFLGDDLLKAPMIFQSGDTWFAADIDDNDTKSKKYFNYEWNPISKSWQMAGELNGEDMGIGFAHPGLFYRTKNYILYLEYEKFVTRNLNNVGSGLRIFKITDENALNERHRVLQPMHIATTNGNNPEKTKPFNGSARTFTKWFDVDIDRIIVRDDYFIVLNKYHELPTEPWCTSCTPRNPSQIPKTDNMIWVFRWNPDLDVNGMWESVVNDPAAGNTDIDGQGLQIVGDVREITAEDDFFTVWCNHPHNGGDIAELMFFQYDYKMKRYPNNSRRYYIDGIDKVKHYFSNNVWVENQKYYYNSGSTDNIQAATIRDRHNLPDGGFTWIENSIYDKTPVVSMLTQKEPLGGKVETKYEYDGTTNQFEPQTNTAYFKNVTVIQGTNPNSFRKQFEFTVDTTATLFGKPKLVKNYNANGQLVASEENTWGIHEQTVNGNFALSVPRLLQKNENVNGIVKTTVWPSNYFDNDNGLPALCYTKNSDGELLVNKTIFAHTIKNDMKNVHMLTQSAGNSTYKIENLSTGKWSNTNVVINETTSLINVPLLNLSEGDVLDVSFTIGALDPVHHIYGFSFPDLIEYRLKVGTLEKEKLQDIIYTTNQKEIHINYKLNAVDVSGGSPSISLNFYGYERRLKVGTINVTVTKTKLDDDQDAISGKAVNWTKDSKGVWRPEASFNWNVNCNANGKPTSTFVPYFGNTSNSNWKYAGKTAMYNLSGNVLETQNALNIPATKNYRQDIGLQTATIENSHFKECGVFTGDYDLNESATNDGSTCFDLENGWKKGSAGDGTPGTSVTQVCADAKHFGEKGLKVTNSYGVVRIFKLEKNKDYIFSAWIKPMPGAGTSPQTVAIERHKVMNVTYRRSQDNGASWPLKVYLDEGSTRELPSGGIFKKIQYGDWYYVELTVPAKKDISDENWNAGHQYAVAWVGSPHGDGTVYIDDIRFYPKNALATSTYYDQKWYQPILSIDVNNNPGRRVSYDEFGRPYIWEKLDLTKATDQQGYKTQVMKKEYHFMEVSIINEYFRITSPGAGESVRYIPGLPSPTIQWVKNPDVSISKVKISLKSREKSWTIAENVDNNGSFSWPLSEITTYHDCQIIISNQNDPTQSNESSGYFTILPNGRI